MRVLVADDHPLFATAAGSDGGEIRIRLRLTSDQLRSGVNPACGRLYGGARMHEVVVGRQAG